MKNKKQLPLLSTSSKFNSTQNFRKKQLSQSSAQETLNMKLSSKSDNLMVNQSNSRYSQFQDTSYLHQKTITPNQLSKIVKNPQLIEYQQTNQRINFYGKLHRNSMSLTNFKTSVTEIDSKDGAIDISPFIKNAKSSQLQYYLKKIIQQQSEKIELSKSLPSRQQVIELQQWFDYMIEQVQDKSVAEELQIIYSSCIQELIRQITIECKERGQLLDRLWNSYISLIDEVVHNINNKNQKEQEINQEYLNQQESLLQNEKLQVEIKQLQEEFTKQENIRLTLEKKLELQEKIILKQISEIKQLHERLEEIQTMKSYENEEIASSNQQSFKYDKLQLKPIKKQQGNSIVSHLMAKKAKFQTESKAQSLSPIQHPKTSEDDLSKTPLSQLQLEFENMDDLQLTGLKYQRKKTFNTENVILDEKSVMTDRMCFSKISVLNDFIHNLIDNGLQAILNEVTEEEYKNSTDIIRCATSISIQQEEYVIQILNKSQIKQKVFENFQKFLCSIEQKVQDSKVKQVEQQLQIKEHQLVAKNLEQNLREATQDFADILENRQQKIESLKEGQKLLLKKLSSLSQEHISSNISSKRSPQFNSPTRKTPSFKNTFDFTKEVVAQEINLQQVEEIDDADNSKSSIQYVNQDQSFQIQQKNEFQLNLIIKDQYLDDQMKDVTLENKEEMNNSFAITNLIRNITESEEIENAQETQIPEKMKNLKNLIQKFGIKKEPVRRATKPIDMRSSIMQVIRQEKQKVKKVSSQNTDVANSLIRDLQQRPSIKQTGKLPILPLVQLQKIIYTLLQEAGKSQDGYKVPLQVAIYDFFLKKYGFKNVAEKKIKQIFSFMVTKLQHYNEQTNKQKHQQSQIKIQFFARLCYMNGEMDELVQKIIIESIKYFTQRDVNFLKPEQQINLELLNEYSEELLTKYLGQFILKQYQSTLKDKKEIIFENEMMAIIDLYFQQKQNCENILEIIIKAADLNGNSLIEFAEFKTLFKAIHPDIYTKQKALENFISFADYFDTETKDKMITLKRFAEMAIQLNLFNQEKIQQYSQGSEQLIERWHENKNLIKYRYIVSENYHKVSYTYQLLAEEIPKFVEKKESQYSLQTLWISYKLLLERSQRVILNYEQKNLFKQLVPVEFGIISDVYAAITEINI